MIYQAMLTAAFVVIFDQLAEIVGRGIIALVGISIKSK